MIRREESLIVIFPTDQLARPSELVAITFRIILEAFVGASGAVGPRPMDARAKSVDAGAGRWKSIAIARRLARSARRIKTPQIWAILSATSL